MKIFISIFTLIFLLFISGFQSKKGSFLNLETQIYKKSQNLNSIKDSIRILSESGRLNYKNGNYLKAKKNYKKALVFSKFLDNNKEITIASLYNDLGETYARVKQLDSCLLYINKSLGLSERYLKGKNDIQARGLYLKGLVFHVKGELSNALLFYNKSLSVFIDEKRPSLQKADVLNNIGVIWKNKGNYLEALKYYEESIRIKVNILSKDNISIAKSYVNIGLLQFRINNLDKAIQYYYKALEILKEGDNLSHPLLSNIYNNLGLIYQEKSDFGLAIEFYEKALSIKEKKSQVANISIGGTFENLGVIYNIIGDFDKALLYYNKALKSKIINKGESHFSLGNTYNNIGLTYYKIKDFKNALIFYEKAMKIREKSIGIKNSLLAEIMLNKGTLLMDIGEFKNAIMIFEGALSILNGSLKENTLISSYLLNNIGKSYFELNDFENALLYFKKSLNIRKTILSEDNPKLVNSFINLGDLYVAMNDISKAKFYFEEGFKCLKCVEKINCDFSKVPDIIKLKHLYSSYEGYLQKRSFISVNYKDSLQLYYKSLIRLNDYISSKSLNKGSVNFFLNEFIPDFEKVIHFFHLNNNNVFTFSLSEKSKNKFLYERLQNLSNSQSYRIPYELKIKEDSLSCELLFYEKKKYIESYEKEISNDSLLYVYNNKILEINEDLGKLIGLFKTQYPDYYKFRYSQKLITVKGVQDSLLENNQTLVEYFVGDSSIFTFVISKDTFSVTQTPKDFPLNQYVENLRKGIYQPYQKDNSISLDSLKELYTKSAYQLYEKLILPVKEFLPNRGELIIIPDGVLGYIPFDALLTQSVGKATKARDYPYLMKDYQTSIAYSATLLQEMRNKRHRKSPSKSFLGVAPLFKGEIDTSLYTSRFIDFSNPRNRLTPLSENISEVQSIQKIVGGDLLIDTAATESAFLDRADNYKVLHFSTHGKANDKLGDYSFLAFYELKDSLENEWLYNRELYDLELNADMVVLSACETGIGELQRGEGIISLARGFSYAGAKSIITSLWAVDDEESSVLMRSFYEYLNDGYTKDAALRQAKLDYIQNSSRPQPYFWATFIPIGDMQPIDFQNGFSWWMWIGGIGILLLTILWGYTKRVKM